jgi:hypothetical protein
MNRNEKGHFVEGNTGKPKGATHKAAGRVKSLLLGVLDEHYSPEKIARYIEDLSDADKLRFFVNLLPYVTPKATPPGEATPDETTPIDLSKLTDDELRYVAALQSKAKAKGAINPPIAWINGGEPITEIKRVIIDPVERHAD